jgi:hypothetical protein
VRFDQVGLGFGSGAGYDLGIKIVDEPVGEGSIAAADVSNSSSRLKEIDGQVDEIVPGLLGGFLSCVPKSMMKGGSPDFPVEGIEVIVKTGWHQLEQVGKKAEEAGDKVAKAQAVGA